MINSADLKATIDDMILKMQAIEDRVDEIRILIDKILLEIEQE